MKGTLNLRNMKLTTYYLTCLIFSIKVGHLFMLSLWWKPCIYVLVYFFFKTKVATKQWAYNSYSCVALEPMWLKTMYQHSSIQVWQPETHLKLFLLVLPAFGTQQNLKLAKRHLNTCNWDTVTMWLLQNNLLTYSQLCLFILWDSS